MKKNEQMKKKERQISRPLAPRLIQPGSESCLNTKNAGYHSAAQHEFLKANST